MSHMEIIFFGRGNAAYKTGCGAAGKTDAETWAMWRDAQPLARPLESAPFGLDYYNRRGDLVKTIGLDRAGFEHLTGRKARGPAYYKAKDEAYWRKVRASAQHPGGST